MQRDNLTAMLYGAEDLRVEQRGIPDISDDEVLVEMECISISNIDLSLYVSGRIGEYILKKPMIIGLEGSGVIVQKGKAVQDFVIGDRVGLEPGYGCRNCNFCKLGRYNICQNIVILATPPNDGLLTKFHNHPADFCYKLPPSVSMAEAAMLEPLSSAIHACRRVGVHPGSNVLIIGSGRAGLLSLLVSQAMGATNITMTDLIQYRLDAAMALCANHTLLVDPDVSVKQTVELIHSLMQTQPNKTIITVTKEEGIQVGVNATRSGGNVVISGMRKEGAFPLKTVCGKELRVRGIFRNCNDFSAALAMIANGKINLKPLITHHYDLADVNQAIHAIRYQKSSCISAMVHCKPIAPKSPCKT